MPAVLVKCGIGIFGYRKIKNLSYTFYFPMILRLNIGRRSHQRQIAVTISCGLDISGNFSTSIPIKTCFYRHCCYNDDPDAGRDIVGGE